MLVPFINENNTFICTISLSRVKTSSFHIDKCLVIPKSVCEVKLPQSVN